MRYTLLIFASFLLSIGGCRVSHPQNDLIQLEIDLEPVSIMGGFDEHLFLVPVDESLAIGQLGGVEIISLDHSTGKELNRLDMVVVANLVNELLANVWGKDYYVPGMSEYRERAVYVGNVSHTLHKFLHHAEKDRFSVFIRYVIFNRENPEDQQLFDVMLFFDEHFEDLEVFPMDYINKGPGSGLSGGGFYLEPNRLFTKRLGFRHQDPFDFVEYKLVDNAYYKLIDTLMGINTSKTGHGARFFTTFDLDDYSYLNLGTGLHRFEGIDIQIGEFLPFPVDSTYSCLFIEPLDSDYLVAYFVNDFENEPDAIGQLVLLDRDLKSAEIIEEFDLTVVSFASFFVYDEVVSLINYKWEDEEFYLTRYSNLR